MFYVAVVMKKSESENNPNLEESEKNPNLKNESMPALDMSQDITMEIGSSDNRNLESLPTEFDNHTSSSSMNNNKFDNHPKLKKMGGQNSKIKLFFKYLFSYILLLISILLVLGGAGYYLYQNGWVEKSLSQLVLPFEWFGQSEVSPVGHLQIKDEDRRSIKDYKEAIEPLAKQVEEDYKKRPSLEELNLSSEARDNLNKILDKIYGVEYTYASQAKIVGVVLTSNGWLGLMNLAVVGDNLNYNNVVVAFSLENDSRINNLFVYLEDEKPFAYSEIPADFDIKLLDQALTEAQTAFTDISIESSRDPFVKEYRQFLNNTVISKLQYIHSYVRVYVVHSVGTDDGIKEFNQTFHLDKDLVDMSSEESKKN